MEQGHGGHLVAFGPHLAESCDDFWPSEQGHKSEILLLLPEGVLGDTHQPCRGGGKSQHQTCLGHTEDRTSLECLMEGTQLLPSQESHFIPRIKLFLL